jgi:3-hydroxyisobutyrate dehydrogenase
MRVGFIGLGKMGAPMAGFVRQAGFPLVVHDLRPDVAGPLLERGAVWADSPRDVAAQCDVVCVCVPGPPLTWRPIDGPRVRSALSGRA